MRLSGITRADDSALEAGHEFHDHRRPSIASSSTKSINFGGDYGGDRIRGLYSFGNKASEENGMEMNDRVWRIGTWESNGIGKMN